MPRLALLATLVLSACYGSVTVEGDAEPFGEVASALWLHVDIGGEQAPGVEHLLLTNVADACAKLDAHYAAVVAYSDAGAAHTDPATYCADLEGHVQESARTAREIWYQGANHAQFDLVRSDGMDLVGAYPSPGQARSSIGSVEYWLEERFEDWGEAWDSTSTVEDGCGAGGLSGGSHEAWRVGDGAINVTRVEEGASMAGTIDLAMEDMADPERRARFTGSFTAERCEIVY